MTNTATYDTERTTAVAAVERAARLCRRVRESLVSDETLSKTDRSPVTIADFGSQAVVNLALAAAFPADGIVAEEESGVLRKADNAALREKVMQCVWEARPDLAGREEPVLTAIARGNAPGGRGRFWTLDPIDGTKGFLRNDQYAVALALIEDGEIVLGVMGCPNLPVDPACPDGAAGCLFYAVRGQGAYVRAMDASGEASIRVTDTADPADAVLCESFESAHTAHDASADVARRLGIRRDPVRMDSQCKYAALARGQGSVYLRLPTRPGYQEKIWDHAAGVAVIRAAGGRVTDTSGRELDFTRGRTLQGNEGIIATNGALHAPVLDAVAAVREQDKGMHHGRLGKATR